MKRTEEVYREMLYQAMEKKNRSLTQSELSKKLSVSLSVISLSIAPLRKMGAIKVQQRGFEIVDIRKILFYWASTRDLEKDLVYSTRANKPVRQIESEMPAGAVFGAFSAYKFMFKDVPADYSEVYVYTEDYKEIIKRFPKSDGPPNIYVLKGTPDMTIAQIFVDLWNIKEWYAKDFLKAMEVKLNGFLE
jgi:hypothetical protein